MKKIKNKDFMKLLTLLLALFTGLSAQRCAPGEGCGNVIDDEASPDTEERIEQDYTNTDDPTSHVPGAVGPFGD